MAKNAFRIVTMHGKFTMTYKEYTGTGTPGNMARDTAAQTLLRMEQAANGLDKGRIWFDVETVEGPM